MPDRLTDRMSKYMPERMSDRIYIYILPDGMSETCQNSVSRWGSLDESICFSLGGAINGGTY